MNCNQAELAMMEHMEKTIHPARARDLAQHVLECESCREYYLGFDMALDVLCDEELSTPPPNFTQTIMAQVYKLPAHTPPEPSASPALRILWGLSAIFVGVALLFAFNPDWLSALTEASAAASSILYAMGAVQAFFVDVWEGLAPGYQASNVLAGLSVFNIALIFVVVVGALLLVLQRSEKSFKA